MDGGRLEILEKRELLSADFMHRPSLELAMATTRDLVSDVNVALSEGVNEVGSGTLIQIGSLEELKARYIEAAVSFNSHLFGQTAYEWGPWPIWLEDGLFLGAPRFGFATTSDATHSETNNQVAGVDEADLMETNGEELFMLSGEEIHIIDVTTPDALKELSSIEVENAQSMHLVDDRLVVISQAYHHYAIPFGWGHWQPDESTMSAVTASIYDVSDGADPQLLQEVSVEGYVTTTRVVDGQLHLVVNRSFEFPKPRVEEGVGIGDGDEDGDNGEVTLDDELIDFDPGLIFRTAPFIPWKPDPIGVYESEADYRKWLDKTFFNDLIPTYEATVYSDAGEVADEMSGYLVTAGSYIADEPEQEFAHYATSFLTIDVGEAGMDQSDADENVIVSPSLLGVTGEIYVSADHLYIAQTRWDFSGESVHTRLYQFAISVDGIELAATGSVGGVVQDRFAMSEDGGYLRVVTADWRWRSNDGSNLYILQRNGMDLEVVGELTDIAPGERLFSTTFAGDMAYVVTFLQIDPFFTIDMSDPTNPVIRGELEIPGVSTYLQVLDENHVVGFGRGAAWRSAKMTLFDVTDPDNPVDEATANLPDGSFLGDSHELAYYPEAGVIAFLVRGDDYRSPNELAVYRVDFESGFELLGQIEHDGWMQRSVRVGDTLFAISTETVTSHPILDPGTTLDLLYVGDEVTLPVEPPDDPNIVPIDPIVFAIANAEVLASDEDPEADEDEEGTEVNRVNDDSDVEDILEIAGAVEVWD